MRMLCPAAKPVDKSPTPNVGTSTKLELRTRSTKTCNECGSQSGPTGLTDLSVRQWSCSDCGFVPDRDVNAARNTLSAAAECAVEGYVYA
jgi:transposase